ncbi:MAG: peptidase M75 [Myxococcales bacterium]|nr:peptidase M75 [Myxococcales bacterium]MCB9519748.1 peptidase M75 [Myxococcales bacterium]MCB9530439.1 peptidase M75 [Myxococcales bacterium]MCB9533687.1 peptidase M75 [Myxococcales bacterium]
MTRPALSRALLSPPAAGRYSARLSTVALAAMLGAAACGDDAELGESFDDTQIVADFADSVVVPTYALLATRTEALSVAVDALGADPTPATLEAAQEAWAAARRPWEQAEAFLFGPVDSFGYDPALDSWPVNRTDLEAVLAASDAFSADYVAGLQETQKGFHTIEYLLFGVDRMQTAADLDARELEYVAAIADELAAVADALHSSWVDTVDGRAPYRSVIATAGDDANTAYPSLTAAAQEILTGMIGICDEVANGKIADPYDSHDPTLVESQFSFNSISDFQDNLRSVQNAYTGDVPLAGTTGRGLTDYVAGLDPALDTRLRAELDAAIAAIGAIPDPFRNAISDPAAYPAIEAAQAAVRTVQNTLEGDVQPLVLR